MSDGWRSTTDDPPDWRDGYSVELKAADGSVVAAELDCDDVLDAMVILSTTLATGEQVSFFDYDYWRPDTGHERR